MWHIWLEPYQALLYHLKLILPWESTRSRNAFFLDQGKKEDERVLECCNQFNQGVLQKTFPICSTTDKDCNKVYNGWRMYIHSQKAAIKMKQMKLLMDDVMFHGRKTPLKLLVYHLILNLNASLILILLSYRFRKRLLTMPCHPNSLTLHLCSK